MTEVKEWEHQWVPLDSQPGAPSRCSKCGTLDCDLTFEDGSYCPPDDNYYDYTDPVDEGLD